jgi:hypothetical protein
VSGDSRRSKRLSAKDSSRFHAQQEFDRSEMRLSTSEQPDLQLQKDNDGTL